MERARLENFKEFAKNIEYPMVVFEAESGKVLIMNYEAEVLLGNKVTALEIEPGRNIEGVDFWATLRDRKSMIWHRLQIKADGKPLLVSGLINEGQLDGETIYTILFECRSDMTIGSITLERIVDHAGVVALHIGRKDGNDTIDYVSKNVNQYGYTRAEFYEEKVKPQDIICEEDFPRLLEATEEDIKRHVSEDVLECRVLTEQRELIPVRMMIHYVYNDYGILTSLEILVFDMTEEHRKNREARYLNNAIAKMNHVVIVKSFSENGIKLRYISPNAEMLGMNTEMLSKGYKLTEDYIHPEDRESVIATITQMAEGNLADYELEYRMVRDDGRRIWVENLVTINKNANDETEISFLITDITKRKEMEMEMAVVLEDVHEETVFAPANKEEQNTDVISKFQNMAEALGRDGRYYCVLLDTSGRTLTRPVGPADYMGMFYDIFERPVFKEQFDGVAKSMEGAVYPKTITMDMGQEQANLIFAPVKPEDRILSYWVLASFTEEGKEAIQRDAEMHWNIANSLSRYIGIEENAINEISKSQYLELQLRKEMESRKLIENLVRISDKNPNGVYEACDLVGSYLKLAHIGVYVANSKVKTKLLTQWSKQEGNVAIFQQLCTSGVEYDAIREHFKDGGYLAVDKGSDNEFLKGLVSKTGMGAILLVDIQCENQHLGYIMFADADSNCRFDDATLQLAKLLGDIVSKFVGSQYEKESSDLIRKGLWETYNHIRDAVFVKNNDTGEIIYTNKAMDKLYGKEYIGMKYTDVVNDKMSQYLEISGVRRHFVDQKKVTKWRSYIKEIDQIMNIVELHLGTIDGNDCSLVILKKYKNKDKKKS